MKPSLAHLSPTLPAALATGAAVALSVFLLAGAEPQGEPAPLLPAIGGAAVHVIAKLPATPGHHARKAVARPASRPAPVDTVAQHVALVRQAGVIHAQRPKHQRHVRVHRAVPAQVAPRAAPAPVVTRQTFHAQPGAKGKARGHSHSHFRSLGHNHSHGHAPAGAPTVAGTHGHGHGAARGHTHHGASRGHAKNAPSAPHNPEHAAPPKTGGGGPPPDHGGGNGHGGKK